MQTNLLSKGMSRKAFLSLCIAFLVLAMLVMGLGGAAVPTLFFIIAIPLLLLAFYLRGIHGGLSKAYILTPIILVLIAAIVLCGLWLYMEGGHSGTDTLTVYLFLLVTANPGAWLIGACIGLIALIFFLKVAFAEAKTDLSHPAISTDELR